MPELGLFPLGIVLLPSERLPLHIFEPRYRELIGECVEHEREFGLLLADDEGMRRVGTRAAVVGVLQRFSDGRLNIAVEGRERFRLRRLTSGRSFRTAEVEPLVDDDAPTPEEQADRALAAYRRLARVAGAEIDEPEAGSRRLSFELAARVELEPSMKQELLELTSERDRLGRVTDLLSSAASALALAEERRRRAAGNGRVLGR